MLTLAYTLVSADILSSNDGLHNAFNINFQGHRYLHTSFIQILIQHGPGWVNALGSWIT